MPIAVLRAQNTYRMCVAAQKCLVFYAFIFKVRTRKEIRMTNILLIFGIILLVLWLLGLVSSYTLGGFIYVALVIGLILVIVSLVPRFRGRR